MRNAEDMEETNCPLDGIELLQGLSPDERKEIESLCQCRRYRKNDHIIERDAESRDVLFIVKGRVQILNISPAGRSIPLDEIPAGGFCGELAAIDGYFRSASIWALEDDTWVAFLPHARFLRLLQDHSTIARKLMLRLASVIRQSTDQVMELSFAAYWREFMLKFPERPTLAISGLYLFVSLSGIIYNVSLYYQLKVNIVSYYDISDFLLSGLKEPLVIATPPVALLVALTVAFVARKWYKITRRGLETIVQWCEERKFNTKGLFYRLLVRSRNYYDALLRRRRLQDISIVSFYLLIAWAFVGIVGWAEAESILRNEKSIIFYKNDNKICVVVAKDGKVQHLPQLRNIGSTQKFLFVFDKRDDTRDGFVRVLPLSTILRVDVHTNDNDSNTEETCPDPN